MLPDRCFWLELIRSIDSLPQARMPAAGYNSEKTDCSGARNGSYSRDDLLGIDALVRVCKTHAGMKLIRAAPRSTDAALVSDISPVIGQDSNRSVQKRGLDNLTSQKTAVSTAATGSTNFGYSEASRAAPSVAPSDPSNDSINGTACSPEWTTRPRVRCFPIAKPSISRYISIDVD